MVALVGVEKQGRFRDTEKEEKKKERDIPSRTKALQSNASSQTLPSFPCNCSRQRTCWRATTAAPRGRGRETLERPADREEERGPVVVAAAAADAALEEEEHDGLKTAAAARIFPRAEMDV